MEAGDGVLVDLVDLGTIHEREVPWFKSTHIHDYSRRLHTETASNLHVQYRAGMPGKELEGVMSRQTVNNFQLFILHSWVISHNIIPAIFPTHLHALFQLILHC